MNLHDFINYRSECPICGESNLSLTFHSNRRQKHTVEDNRYLIFFDMKGIGRQKDYKVGFSLDKTNNSFIIEFVTKSNAKLYDYIDISLIIRFEEFLNNLGIFRFYMTCKMCDRYSYNSEQITFDFIDQSISNIEINTEYFGMSEKIDETNYNIYRLLNKHKTQRSELLYFKSNSESSCIVNSVVPLTTPFMDLPQIKFVSHQKTLDRIKKLLIFS